MKIHAKIIAGHLVGLLLMLAVTLYFNHAGQQLILEDAGRHSRQMASQWIRQIGHDLDMHINDMVSVLGDSSLRAFLTESNAHFVSHQERDAAIARQKNLWSRPGSAQFIDTPFSAALRDRFAGFLQSDPGRAQHAEVLVANRYGAIAAQSHRTVGYDQADASWWRFARDRGVHIEVIHDVDDTSSTRLSIALRIDGSNGDFAGVIRAVVPMATIIPNSLIDGKLHENTSIGLFTREGLRLFSPEGGRRMMEALSPLFIKNFKEPSGWFRDPSARVIAYAGSDEIESFRGLGWVLALGHDEADILAQCLPLQKRIFLIAAMAVLLSLASAWLIAKRIADPIVELGNASQEVANGNLSKQVSVRGRDEIAHAARNFNRMTTVFNVTCMQLRQKVASSELAQGLLEENEHRLFQFLDAMPVGVFITDHTGAPYFANQAAQSILGEVIGPDQLTHAYPLCIAGTNEPYPEERMPIVQALKGQFATADDMEIHHPDRRIPIMVWASPVYDARGKILFATAAFSDISQLKETENALKATASELKRSNAELEQFAYIASHDLQEPLRKVGSYMELVADRYREQLDQDGREFIDYAVDGARRMKVMINDLLMYSRVGTKGKPFAPTDAMKVMQDVISDLELTIQDNHARITFDSLPVVTADDSQLQQLFRNLIGNAVKYRGQDPPQIHVSAQRQKRAWRFSVQDNGIGMEARFFERIFQIFQRLHGPGRYNGTGIGLAICKKIVERHGGGIEVESTPGHGSTFSFTMPDREEN